MVARLIQIILFMVCALGCVTAYANEAALCPFDSDDTAVHCVFTKYDDAGDTHANKKFRIVRTVYAPDGTALEQQVNEFCAPGFSINESIEEGYIVREITILNKQNQYETILAYRVVFGEDSEGNLMADPRVVAIDLTPYDYNPRYKKCRYGTHEVRM